jgi:TorA maturation chaperone TorD
MADGYRILAGCYYPPDDGQDGRVHDLASVISQVCPDAEQDVRAMQEIIPHADRIIDYSRLFVGPFAVQAPPYGAVYLDPGNRGHGTSAAGVRDFYLEMGLELSRDCRELPDHISVELEFMHFLCIKEAEAASRSDLETVLHFSQKQKEFIDGSLGWVNEFTDRIRAGAATGFYRGLAGCTRIFIDSHLNSIRSLVGWVQRSETHRSGGAARR